MEQPPKDYQLKLVIEKLEKSLDKLSALEYEIKDTLMLAADLYERITNNND